MGVAFFPVFDRKLPRFDPATSINGKPIARYYDQINKLCVKLKAIPLSSFYSESTKETFDKIGEPIPEGVPDKPIVWSDPSVGIVTIEALLNYLEAEPNAFTGAERVVGDLEDLKATLKKAVQKKARFRLRIDI